MLENCARPSYRRAWARAASVATVALALGACSSTKSSPPGPAATTVSGVVTDATGMVLAGVTATAGGVSTTTASNGTFSLNVGSQASLVVDFTKSGYLESSKALTVPAGKDSHLSAVLMAMATAMPLDSTAGGMVTGARGASLMAGPGAFVASDGSAVTGMVQVALTPLTPGMPGELAAYPGALVGSMSGGSPSLLQTYGVLNVTAMQNGQEIQVAPGQTVTVTIPVTAPATGTLPQTQDLWSYNVGTAMWDHEGTAQLSGSAYTAQLSHFSFHNIDGAIVSGMATCVTGIVVDKSGNPVAGADVSPSEGASIDTLITTDSSGRYCTWVLSGGSETLTADATSAPFGEGSISVTGAAGMSFPSMYPYACSSLACQTAPNIVLDQPPCVKDGDCPSGDTCCTVKGAGLCLQDFACSEATGSFPGFSLDGSVPPFSLDGSVPPGSGGCSASTGSITATLAGQTYTFDCYGVVAVSNQTVEFTGRQTSDAASDAVFILELNDSMGLSTGTALAFSDDGGGSVDLDSGVPQATLILTRTNAQTDVLECTAASGTVTLNPWSSTVGSMVGIAISNDTQLNCVSENSADANFANFTGTMSGTVTLPLL
jgi:hypothetical protein